MKDSHDRVVGEKKDPPLRDVPMENGAKACLLRIISGCVCHLSGINSSGRSYASLAVYGFIALEMCLVVRQTRSDNLTSADWMGRY